MIEHGEFAGMGGPDKRRERRVAVTLPATVAGRACQQGSVVDVSMNGCLLRCEARLDTGSVVDLEISLPDGPLRMKARVAQSSLDGHSLPGPARHLTGLEFLGLAAADAPRLRSFLEAESRRSPGAG